jgi:alpha-D-ribose 1-methylphosphonate 5-triphosphate synthase subunit PhnG
MLHAVDDSSQHHSHERRRRWLPLLARAPLERLEAAVGNFPGENTTVLRAPETGLLMVRGRIGGTGNRFNLGEVTVTRCVLRVVGDDQRPAVGVAYVLGRSSQRARLAALADALLQCPGWLERLQSSLLDALTIELAAAAECAAKQAQATRVEFYTLARENEA